MVAVRCFATPTDLHRFAGILDFGMICGGAGSNEGVKSGKLTPVVYFLAAWIPIGAYEFSVVVLRHFFDNAILGCRTSFNVVHVCNIPRIGIAHIMGMIHEIIFHGSFVVRIAARHYIIGGRLLPFGFVANIQRVFVAGSVPLGY